MVGAQVLIGTTPIFAQDADQNEEKVMDMAYRVEVDGHGIHTITLETGNSIQDIADLLKTDAKRLVNIEDAFDYDLFVNKTTLQYIVNGNESVDALIIQLEGADDAVYVDFKEIADNDVIKEINNKDIEDILLSWRGEGPTEETLIKSQYIIEYVSNEAWGGVETNVPNRVPKRDESVNEAAAPTEPVEETATSETVDLPEFTIFEETSHRETPEATQPVEEVATEEEVISEVVTPETTVEEVATQEETTLSEEPIDGTVEMEEEIATEPEVSEAEEVAQPEESNESVEDFEIDHYVETVEEAPAVEGTKDYHAIAQANPENAGLQPHVARYKEEVADIYGVDSFSLYRPGDPQDHGKGLAVDFMVPVGSQQGDDIAQYSIHKMNSGEENISYVIWEQKIYGSWTDPNGDMMEDRGSITQNHYDHVHVSFHAE